MVRYVANALDVRERSVYRYIAYLRSEGMPVFKWLRMSPIAVSKHNGDYIIYLPNRLVGLELVATLLFILSIAAVSVFSLFAGHYGTVLQNSLMLLLLLVPLLFRYFLYLLVRRFYIPELARRSPSLKP